MLSILICRTPKEGGSCLKNTLGVMRRSRDIALDQLVRKTRGYSAADIAQICEAALRRSIISNEKVVAREHVMQAVAEQKRRKEAISYEE